MNDAPAFRRPPSDARFVYRCLDCPRVYLVGCGVVIRCDACGSKEREHTATVDPALRLLAILNADPDDRARLVAETRGEVTP